MQINLELEKAISKINEKKPKTVLVQLPDGLKPKAREIKRELEKTGVEVYFWLNSCYGACDIPKTDVDLLIQFGHAEWR